MRLERSTGNIPGRVPRGTEPIASQPPSRGDDRDLARVVLARGLESLRIAPPPEALERLAGLAVLLAQWAPRMNLTGHRGAEEIARRLVVDALALVQVLPPFSRLVDLGSGAGFPGLPIAILYPEREIISVEARSRRVSFQRRAARDLGIENVRILLTRIEEHAPMVADGVVAQALAEPEKARALMLPWAKPGGWIAIPGTRKSLADPLRVVDGCSPGTTHHYGVPQTGADRLVWLADKTS